jgi:transcriptional regulator GlxA family with amidase domain
MSQLLDIANPGCASLDAFSRNRVLTAAPLSHDAALPATRHPPASPMLPGEGRSPVTRLSDRAKILRSIAYMQEHLTERMQVNNLAARINVSASYFFALFKRQTGYAPIDFFIHLRMRRACTLLDSTALSVKEIADRLGYDDAFYFSRLFKSVVSRAPTEYRVLPAEVREEIARQILPEKVLDGGTGRVKASRSPAALESPEACA